MARIQFCNKYDHFLTFPESCFDEVKAVVKSGLPCRKQVLAFCHVLIKFIPDNIKISAAPGILQVFFQCVQHTAGYPRIHLIQRFAILVFRPFGLLILKHRFQAFDQYRLTFHKFQNAKQPLHIAVPLKAVTGAVAETADEQADHTEFFIKRR